MRSTSTVTPSLAPPALPASDGYGTRFRRSSRDSDAPGGSLTASLRRKLMRQGSGPPAVPQGMHFHPDLVLPLAQFQRARAPWHVKVPMVAAAAPRQLTLASNEEASAPALVEGLPGGQSELELEHGGLRS